MKLIAKKDFVMNDHYYSKGDEVQTTDFDKIVKLNENGYIEPLSAKEIINFKEETKETKEEAKWHK